METIRKMNRVYLEKKLLEMRHVDKSAKKMNAKKFREKVKQKTRKFKHYNVNAEGFVLDCGAGVGADIAALLSINKQIEAVGIDMSRQALKFAKKHLPNKTHFVRADIQHLPFCKNTFNLINVSNVLHHHPLTILKEVIGNLKETLKPNGTLFIREPCEPSEQDSLREEITRFAHYLKEYEKIKSIVKSNKRKAHLRSLFLIFGYGTTYTSLLTKILAENNLKIEKIEKLRRKLDKSDIQERLEKAEKEIRKAGLTQAEKHYLLEKLSAIQEKLKVIKPVGEKFVIIKAKACLFKEKGIKDFYNSEKL